VRRYGPPVLVILMIVAVAALDADRYLARLPERVAVHFDGAGNANGWMARDHMAEFDLMVGGLVLAVCLGAALSTRFLPVRMINVPHREYWFAPERRRESMDRLTRHVLWVCCLVFGLMAVIDHVIYQVNLRPGPARLTPREFLMPLVAFLLGLALWVLRLYRMFPRREESPPVAR
jgi:uncharacterized membrane protein